MNTKKRRNGPRRNLVIQWAGRILPDLLVGIMSGIVSGLVSEPLLEWLRRLFS